MNTNDNSGGNPRPLFLPGQVYATPGALAALEEAQQTPLEFLVRHVRGEWGDLVAADVAENERALQTGGRIFSAYHTSKGERIWVISDASEHPRMRQTTTILTPAEY